MSFDKTVHILRCEMISEVRIYQVIRNLTIDYRREISIVRELFPVCGKPITHLCGCISLLILISRPTGGPRCAWFFLLGRGYFVKY